MRMRKKPNLLPRLESCRQVCIEKPELMKGRWLEEFSGFDELRLELGCGKGRFTAETAMENPDVLFIAVERVPEAAVVAMERVSAAKLGNVRFLVMDVSNLTECFDNGELSQIYINFCDPWPKNRDAKRRLTSHIFLPVYKMLIGDGELHFKTDNVPLFDYSLKQFRLFGFSVSETTKNLHENGIVGVMTDYEDKFQKLGKPICRCVAKVGEG